MKAVRRVGAGNEFSNERDASPIHGLRSVSGASGHRLQMPSR